MKMNNSIFLDRIDEFRTFLINSCNKHSDESEAEWLSALDECVKFIKIVMLLRRNCSCIEIHDSLCDQCNKLIKEYYERLSKIPANGL